MRRGATFDVGSTSLITPSGDEGRTKAFFSFGILLQFEVFDRVVGVMLETLPAATGQGAMRVLGQSLDFQWTVCDDPTIKRLEAGSDVKLRISGIRHCPWRIGVCRTACVCWTGPRGGSDFPAVLSVFGAYAASSIASFAAMLDGI